MEPRDTRQTGRKASHLRSIERVGLTINKTVLEVELAILRGKVVSGRGDFSYWIEKLHDHYLGKTGMRLFPGTLNVQLEEPYSLPTEVIRLEAQEYGGSVSVNIVPCSVSGKNAFILRTDANEEGRGHHPRTIVEVATDVRLRDYLHLSDGDLVEIDTFDTPAMR